MKVAIITITNGQNYGNRLQNYALQEILKKMNCTVETIYLLTYRDGYKTKTWYRNAIWLIKKFLHKPVYRFKYYQLRKKCFDIFNNKYITFSDIRMSDKRINRNIANDYDYFICGSDQVWNPNILSVKENIKCHLACFASPEQRIAYAASFGINEIPGEMRDFLGKELKQFKAIGVREKIGEKIVKDCCGRDDTVTVLDPTMMLTSESWLRIANRPDYITSNYQKFIVTYFLGEESELLTDYIEEVSKKFNATVIRLNIEFLSDDKIYNNEHFCTSPDEFVWLIANSECVLTDSFHATVFSLLFHKPFCVFERKVEKRGNNMGSRIDTLLGYFGFESMRDSIDNPTKIPQKYDGNEVDKVLAAKRAESLAFLKNALD